MLAEAEGGVCRVGRREVLAERRRREEVLAEH